LYAVSIRIASLACVLLWTATASAQETPVVKTRSRTVTITDGLHVKKNYWYVMPERSPDVYYVEIPLRPHKVTFTTDVESISFDVTFGSRHQFVIKLDDGRDARTEIRTDFRNLLSARRKDTGLVTSTIPFTLGDNDKIYLKGRFNGGPLLDLQFDLGSGGTIIKKASVPKANMTFDGTVTLHNSDGTNVVPSSRANRLEIEGLSWTGVPVAVADNMTHREDGLIGNVLFQDKVLEIDYDRMLIVVHDDLPALASAWKRDDVLLDGGVVPFVQGSLSASGSSRDGWFMLDTGAYTSILNSDRLGAAGKIASELRRLLGPLGGDTRGPALTVGGHTFSNTNYSVRRFDGDASRLGLLGNDVLKRFNLVLDNRNGAVYFRPNARMADAFRNPERALARALALGVMAITAGWFAWRRRRKMRRPLPPTPAAAR
jgi:hypothetical protein